MYLGEGYIPIPKPEVSKAAGCIMSDALYSSLGEIYLGFYRIHTEPYYLNENFGKLWKEIQREKK